MDRDARTLALARAIFALGLIISTEANAAPPRAAAGRVLVRWIGQEGQDYVGPNNRPEPSDVQDIHLVIGGLDPRREVVFVDVSGQGGDQWHFNQQSFAWKAELKRAPGSGTADFYMEPARVEVGRSFHAIVRYDDGSTLEGDFRGRTATPRLRMPKAKLAARWVGQDGSDWTSTGPSVGPDRLQDACVRLSGISTKVAARSLLIEEAGAVGTRWEFGVNPKAHHNAELVLDPRDRSQGSLYFQPTRDLEGRTLKLTLTYVNETIDAIALTAGASSPTLETPQTPLPRMVDSPISINWIGQHAQAPGGPGDVHLSLSGLTGLGPISGAVLTDSIQGSWAFRTDRPGGRSFHADDPSEPLAFQPRQDRPGDADLFFAPYRDESGAKMTLRLIFEDGKMALARFPGGACDPGKREPVPKGSRIVLKPGDDIQEAADRSGTVVLSPGIYRLSRPLVLGQPVTLTSEGGATLLFSQAPGEAPWTTAIKVHRGHTTLDGFKVRFEGPIRWKEDVSYGPAVIGATETFEPGHGEPKFNLTFTRLDLEIPEVDPGGSVEAVRLMRLRNARSGTMAGNTLRGGPIEFFDGPWRIENNRSLGTVPGTVSSGVFAGHLTHDLILKGNWAEPQGPSGKTWRFLVLTVKGTGDLISGNTIKRIGPRDDDTIPWANSPETMLTEAYSLTYEGAIMALSADRRLLRIGRAQGWPAQTGGVVSILTGPGAGTWCKVAQAIDPSTYLLDEPIPPGSVHVSISRGFVGETYEQNSIDTSGGKRAMHFIFAGNHFGTRLLKNHSIGSGEAFRLTACPTEAPMIWGWSHAPFLGATIADNIIEDSELGGMVGVQHDEKNNIKTNRGRIYMTARVDRNIIRWSETHLSHRARSGGKVMPTGLMIGDQPSLDPAELRIRATGNRVEVPPGSTIAPIMSIPAADFNSRPIVGGKFRFTGDPSFATDGAPSRAAGASKARQSR